VEAKAATEQKAAQEKPAATLPKAPAPVVATPASLDVADTEPPLATSGNTILVTDAVQKAPVQLVASDTEKLEPLQPRSQPLLTMPAQSRVLVPPVAIAQPSPSYPELALRSRTSASVILDLQVDERGKVTRATPMSGPVLFHSAAVAATLKWRYKPASIDGKVARVRVTLNFTLKKWLRNNADKTAEAQFEVTRQQRRNRELDKEISNELKRSRTSCSSQQTKKAVKQSMTALAPE
jgi:TonB family protein